MRKLIRFVLFSICLLIAFPMRSQNIGINAAGSSPNASAMPDVDMSSLTTKTGLLIPRMTGAEKIDMDPLPAAAQRLVVYQTTSTH
ncbi:MAG: hypothetical protein ACJ77K_14495 [Bacteroidia bacterium]